jgi:hypothetical protein
VLLYEFVVVNVFGVQGQPERVLKECEVVVGLVRELQRATVVRECVKESDKRHKVAQYSKGDERCCGRGAFRIATPLIRAELDPLLIEDAIPARCRGPSRRVDMSQSAGRWA